MTMMVMMMRPTRSSTALIVLFVVLLLGTITTNTVTQAGRAPDKAPKLPEGFCPKDTGTATATTGECMCDWQHKDACIGSGCQYQMGLSWYHYTCKDCRCVAEP